MSQNGPQLLVSKKCDLADAKGSGLTSIGQVLAFIQFLFARTGRALLIASISPMMRGGDGSNCFSPTTSRYAGLPLTAPPVILPSASKWINSRSRGDYSSALSDVL